MPGVWRHGTAFWRKARVSQCQQEGGGDNARKVEGFSSLSFGSINFLHSQCKALWYDKNGKGYHVRR